MRWLQKRKLQRKKPRKKKNAPRRRNAAAGPWRRLDFDMQDQEQSKWCWAAVGASVALYYEPQASWTQCRVANEQLERNDCCGNGAAGACNQYGFLASALELGRMPRQLGCQQFGDLPGGPHRDRPSEAALLPCSLERRRRAFRDHRGLSGRWWSGRQPHYDRGSVLWADANPVRSLSRPTTIITATGPILTTRRTEEDNDGDQYR